MLKSIEKIGILGLGHVGLNLALFFCERGMKVVGVDVDEDLIGRISEGESPVREAEAPRMMKKHVDEGNLRATTDFSEVDSVDVILVAVGTPLEEDLTPSQEDIKTAVSSIGPHLRKEQIVIVRSTVVPGTTKNIIKPILEEESGLKAGHDFTLAFCPERLAEGGSMKDFKGSALDDIKKLPVIVGGTNRRDTELVSEFWKGLGLDAVGVTGFKEAEMTKLADNLWIDLNIALANEIAKLSEEIGVDALEVISAANTLPKGQNKVNILYPGSGVGGYCLPKDPWYACQLGKEHDLELKTPKVSREINEAMPQHMFDLTLEALNELGKNIRDSKVSVLGLAFKNSTGDMRNTPAKPLIDLLEGEGITVSAFDPWVNKEEAEKILSTRPENNLEETLAQADCIALVSAHPEFKQISFDEIKDLTSPSCGVVDGRSAFDEEKVSEAGFLYKRIGLGR